MRDDIHADSKARDYFARLAEQIEATVAAGGCAGCGSLTCSGCSSGEGPGASSGSSQPFRSTLRGRIARGDVAASCPIGTALRNEAGETVGSIVAAWFDGEFTVADIVMADDAPQIWEYVGTPADIEAVRQAAMAQSDRTNVLIPLNNPSEVARLRALALEILDSNEALCLQTVHQHLLGPEEAGRRRTEIREACEAKRREINDPLYGRVAATVDEHMRRYIEGEPMNLAPGPKVEFSCEADEPARVAKEPL